MATTENTETVATTAVEAGMTKQTIITISIVSAIMLLFLGLGLGFLIGNRFADRSDDNRTRLYNQRQLPGGMMRGGYYQQGTQTTPSTGTTDDTTQTN